jgi:hypothetical protein
MLSHLSYRKGMITFSVFEELYVEVAVFFDPALVDLGLQGSDQPQSRCLVWKYLGTLCSIFPALVTRVRG